MDEDAQAPQENNANVIALLEKMQIQQKEDAFLQNERISNLYNLVKVQNEIFQPIQMFKLRGTPHYKACFNHKLKNLPPFNPPSFSIFQTFHLMLQKTMIPTT